MGHGPAFPARRALPRAASVGFILAIPAVVVVIALLASQTWDIPMDVITRDPLATAEMHPLTGLQSLIGAAILWLTASISLFGYAVLRGSGKLPGAARFLLWSGLLTALLAIDDQLQIHDDLAARHLGARERIVVVTYVGLFALYLVSFARVIRQTEWLLLALGGALFATSIGLDYVAQESYQRTGAWSDPIQVVLFLEDAAKLFGIVAWAAYYLRSTYGMVTAPPAAPHD